MPVYRINNYFLWSISRPGKSGVPQHDLSSEDLQVLPEGLTPTQMKYERVIVKVFNHYDIPLGVTESIRATFKSKLWRMGKLFSRLGGTKRKQQLLKWENGNNSLWNFEVSQAALNTQMIKRKRSLEKQLSEEVAKRKKIEVEVKALRSTARQQAKAISRFRPGRSENSRGSSSKSWHQYSRQQRHNKRKMLASNVTSVLTFCSAEGFKPHFLELENIDTGCVEVLDVQNGTLSVRSHSSNVVAESDKVHKALLVKDKCAISNNAFHELSMVSDLPSSSQIKRLAYELNKTYCICPSPNGIVGVQQSLKERLSLRLTELIRKFEADAKPVPTTFRVKLTGDGTQIARGLTVVNIAFTILEEGSCSRSASGNHSLSIMKISENYDDLARGLEDINSEARDLEILTLDGVTYNIVFFLGGDWKFLAMVCGLDSATCEYACIWCKCPKRQRSDMTMCWSITDVAKGTRTVIEIQEKSKLSKASKLRYNCSRKPIFPFIPMHRVVIDSLHLFLRISNVLINLLIRDLRILDGIDCGQKNIKTYEVFLNESCKIKFVDKDSKKLKWRDLTGPEKVRLFTHIDIPALFPSLEAKNNLQELWTSFFKLIQELKLANATVFATWAKHWIESFVSIYQAKDVTPYMHAFAMHVPEFMSLHGDVVAFTQQGLEKLNDLTTQHFQRASNHRDYEALKQILEKWNRIETLEDNGHSREKRTQTCSNCKAVGHNKRSCTVLQPLNTNTEM